MSVRSANATRGETDYIFIMNAMITAVVAIAAAVVAVALVIVLRGIVRFRERRLAAQAAAVPVLASNRKGVSVVVKI